MPFFDTHNHLDYLQFERSDPLARLVQNAQSADVQMMLIVAVQQADFTRLANMQVEFPQQLRYALGLHPLYIQQHTAQDLIQLEQRLSQASQGCTAIGEIGLERAVPELLTPELWRKQLEFFEAQLALAQQYQLPVNIHSRKAHEQVFQCLKRASLAKSGVVHGFAGSYEQAKRFVDLGYKIGVGGTITYERANKTRQTIARLPLEALLLETDSPDMPLFGFQGQPNRPERIVNVFNVLAELRTEPKDIIAQTIWQNSCNLFG